MVSMPALTTTMTASNKGFRPSQEFLDVFWTLSEGNDDQRNKCAIKLGNMIKRLKEDDEKEQILKYCRERLIRGLSSGRKFARVGFSVALTRLLRQFSSTDATEVLDTIKDKLKVVRNEKKSKREVGGIYLGRTFAYSAIIKSGIVKQLEPAALESIVEELTTLSEKKSYLKPVCTRTLEDLISQVSLDIFGEHIWPRLRDVLKQGWNSCTLVHLALLVTCRNHFPDIVNKKFVKKHWGFPLLGEDNDEHLLRVIGESASQKLESSLQTVLQHMLKTREAVSIWSRIGDKLMEPGKKGDTQASKQQLALHMATHLARNTQNSQQVLDMLLCPALAKKVFHSGRRKNDPVTDAVDALFKQVESSLEPGEVCKMLDRLWTLDDGQLVASHNFSALLAKMPLSDVENYSNGLMNIVKGVDSQDILSEDEVKKGRQKEAALRQLQHLACSQKSTSLPLQKSVLSLLLRLAFFTVGKKNKSIQHCESRMNFTEDSNTRKLCETFFFKSLDQLSTLRTVHQPKVEHLKGYIELMCHLGQYCMNLMRCDTINPIKPLEDGVVEEWEKIAALTTKMAKEAAKSTRSENSAFVLLLTYLGFQSLTDAQVALDLIQEVTACYDKASAKTGASSEPAWVEVLTEVLLQLVSNPSHLGRVVAAVAFDSVCQHLTPEAVQLIAQVLIPKSGHKDDAGGVLVEADNGGGEEEEEDNDDDDNHLLDEDVPDEESSDDDQEDEEEMEAEDDDEDGMQIDDEFRKKVKEALGPAAGDSEEEENVDDDEDEDLPDLSDSEMFKLDEMLAEVFRQRKKAGNSKKDRLEKMKEMANFRSRVLDLVEVLVKGDRCGDFVLELLKPLLLMALKLHKSDLQALSDRSRGLINLIKSKLKALTDDVHSSSELTDFFQELLDLAHKVSEGDHVRQVALACHIVMSLCRSSKDKEAADQCMDKLRDTLTSVINKKHSKIQTPFFTSLIALEPGWYQDLAPGLLPLLKDPEGKSQSKVITCSVLASLTKKKESNEDIEGQKWMKEAAAIVSGMVTSLDKGDIKIMLTKELFTLALALTTRVDIFQTCPFTLEIRQRLMELKPKLNTDLRRLANKLITIVERAQLEEKQDKKNKKKKKEASEEPEPPAKKKRKS